MLSTQLETAVVEIASLLEAAGVDYYLGGSAMLALRGFDVSPGDLDFVVEDSARTQVELIFAKPAVETVKGPWRSSWLLRTTWGSEHEAVGVDVVGDLAIEIDGVVARLPVSIEDHVELSGLRVPLGPLRHWYHLYRVHAPEKAARIAAGRSDDELVQGAGELGISASFSPTLIVRIGNESEPDMIEETMSTDQQSSIIEVASPTDLTFDEPGTGDIDLDLLGEALEYIRPALQADGGDLVLLGTQGGKVTLQLVGACGGCPLSTMTLTSGIERILRDRVPGVTEVVSV